MDKLIIAARKDLIAQKKKKKIKPNQFVGTSSGILSIYVTPSLISRALKFIDIFIKELKSKGYEINHKDYRGTLVIIDGIELPIRLREKCRRVMKDDRPWRTSELEPIGKLIFTLDAFPRKEWEDSKNKLLELKIPNIISYMERKAKEEIEYSEARKEREKDLEIQRQNEAEIRQRQELEEQKFEDLLEACEKWNQATKIREYVSAVESYSKNSNSLTPQLENWITWSKRKADEIDPLLNNNSTSIFGTKNNI